MATDVPGGSPFNPEVIFCTSSGRIGVIFDVEDKDLAVELTSLQRNLAHHTTDPELTALERTLVQHISGAGGHGHTRCVNPSLDSRRVCIADAALDSDAQEESTVAAKRIRALSVSSTATFWKDSLTSRTRSRASTRFMPERPNRNASSFQLRSTRGFWKYYRACIEKTKPTSHMYRSSETRKVTPRAKQRRGMQQQSAGYYILYI